MKPKKLAEYCGYWDNYDKFGSGINHGEINFYGEESSCLIREPGNQTEMYVIMPMHL